MAERRIGRLIVDDGRITEGELSDIVRAINQETAFTADQSTPLRVDVFKEYSDE